MLFKMKSIETISLAGVKIGRLLKKSDNYPKSFFNKNKDHLKKLAESVDLLIEYAGIISDTPDENVYKKGMATEDLVDKLYMKLKKNGRSDLKKKKTKKSINAGLVFLELIKEFERTGDYLQQIININYGNK